MSLRHRLHVALVESGEKQLERVKSLPKMSELVMVVRDEVRPNSSCCLVNWGQYSVDMAACAHP